METRIPLAGSLIIRNQNSAYADTKDQRFVNCFPELVTNSITGSATISASKRPGLVAGSIASGYTGCYGTGCYWSGYASKIVFPFRNGTSSRVYDSGGSQIGDTLTGSYGGLYSYITETLISGTPYLTWMVTSGAGLWTAWYIAGGGGSWTQITDADFPLNQTPALITRGPMVHLDGYAFIQDTNGNIWNSDLNSLANWSATSFINAQSEPDVGMGLAKTHNLIAAFGPGSLEFFQNSGNPSGSPLSRVQGSRRIGVAGSLLNIYTASDVIYFIGHDVKAGNIGVYSAEGTLVSKISTPSIDRWLNTGGGAYILGSFPANGLSHLLLRNNYNLFSYCIETKFWWEFISGSPEILACIGANGSGYFSSNTAAAGAYRMAYVGDSMTYQDASRPYAARIRASLIDGGNSKNKFWNWLRLVGDRQATSGNTEVIWSDDDYATFSTGRNYLSLPGAAGDYASTPDAAVLDITGDIDIIAYAVATSWTAATQSLVAKFADTANRSYQFFVNAANGIPQFSVSPDGTTGAAVTKAASAAVPFAAGSGGWLRATLDVTDGVNSVFNFYTSTDAPSTAPSAVSWTQLGTANLTSTVTSIFNSTSPLEIGAQLGGTGARFTGKIYSAYVYNGIGGTLAAAFLASDVHPRITSVTSSLTAEVWTVNGAAFITSESSIDLSTANNRLSRLGMSRRRAYEVIDGVNRPWRVEALELDYREGR